MALLAAGVCSRAEAREGGSEQVRRHVDIAAGTLPDAIAQLSRQAHVSIGAQGPLPDIRTPRIRGDMSVEQALARLLAGSGFRARQAGREAWRIEPLPTAAPITARAAVIAPPAEFEGEPIIVTATKQPLDLLSLPAAVSVVRLAPHGEGADDAGSTTIASRLEGLSLTSLGPGRNRMFLRGVADSAFGGESQSTVAVVLDEARLTYAAPDPDIRLVDMDRVEVLKGPQGSLYGTGALGGIYRMVSRPVDLEQAGASLAAGGSRVVRGAAGHSVSAVVNLPLADTIVGARLVGYREIEGGWVDTGARGDGNRSRVSGVRAQLAVVPADGWQINLTGLGQWLSSHDSRYTYARHAFSRPDQLREPHDNDLTHLAARISGQVGDIDILLASAITRHDVDDRQDATRGAEGFGLADPQLLVDRRSYRTTDSELRLRGRWGGAEWLAGLALLDARQHLDTALSGRGGDSLTLDDDLRDSHDAAAYFDVSVPLADTLSVDAGARLFHASIRETRMLASGPVSRQQAKTGMTPSLALAWQPTARRLIYLRYGGAFRQGGSDITASGTVETLKGDELASIEAGWREGLGGDSRLELSTWYSSWENVQSDVLESDGLVETANAGDARIIGAEASLDVRVARHWRMEAGASLTDALLVRNALGYRLEDRRLPVVPRYTLRGAIRRDVMLGPADAWVRLDLRLVGPARMSFDPAIDRALGARVESSLEGHLALGRWQLGIVARNLLGDRGNVFAFGNALRYRSTAQFSPQQPFTILLQAGVTM